MSYEKQIWKTGDIITAEKLNHMEDGIAGGGSNMPMCTVTYKLGEGIGITPQITFNGANMLNPYSYALNSEEPYGIPSPFTLNISDGTTVKFLYHVIDDVWSCVVPTGGYDVVSTEDVVNYDDGDILDPSKDSSITLVLSSK